jgi:hypothetical protein
MQTLFKRNDDSIATVNDLPYLGFGGVVLARLKGERRQALQGYIPFVILTDLNLGSHKKQH